MLSNCGAGEDSWESLSIARRLNQSILKGINPEYSLEGLMLKLKLNTLATWFEELTHWKISWCWEILTAGRELGDWGWDVWMTSSAQWTWVWGNSGRWWRTGKPGVLQSMEMQIVGHKLVTKQVLSPNLKSTVSNKYEAKSSKYLNDNFTSLKCSILSWLYGCYCCLLAKSRPTLATPWTRCNPSGSSGVFQARTPEWVAISFSRASSQHRNWTCISCIGGQILYCWASKEVQGYMVRTSLNKNALSSVSTCFVVTSVKWHMHKELPAL